jgi:acetyl-CoA carboxylase carboxyltransferase component
MTTNPAEEHAARSERIRTEMGGADKLLRLRERGRRTIRERIDALVDAGSFEEHGTFAWSKRETDREETPGDGKVGGFALIDGRPVAVYGDDITVRQGSSALVGMRKTRRLEQLATRAGCPIIDIGETGGARIPDILGAIGITGAQMSPEKGNRNHRVPSATVIVGKSFGGSSIASARGDFTVQVRGSCLAITSPRVFEVAIGERIGFEELGGVDVHSERTGQIDLAVDTEDEAWHAVRRWLSYLPSNAWLTAPRADPAAPAATGDAAATQDGRALAGQIVDDGSWFELRPRCGRSLLTALARIDGWPVGMIVSDPRAGGGLIDAHGCEKATRLLVLCDSFDLPVVSLVDCAGLAPDDADDQERVLYRFTKLRQALALASCPRLLVVTGSAFGLAFASAQHSGWATDGAYAWPGASLGLPDGGDAARSAYEAAGVLGLDEIIEPAATRQILTSHLARLARRRVPDPSERRLSYWSSC